MLGSVARETEDDIFPTARNGQRDWVAIANTIVKVLKILTPHVIATVVAIVAAIVATVTTRATTTKEAEATAKALTQAAAVKAKVETQKAKDESEGGFQWTVNTWKPDIEHRLAAVERALAKQQGRRPPRPAVKSPPRDLKDALARIQAPPAPLGLPPTNPPPADATPLP